MTKIIDNDILNCIFCSRFFCGKLRFNSMTKHAKTHGIMTSKELYDIMFKTETCGFCQTPSCGCPTKFINLTQGYSRHCNSKCAALDPMRNEKLKKTMIDKYGLVHNFSGKHGTRKCDKTLLKKYGVSSPILNQAIKLKTEQTMLEKYGKKHNFSGKFGTRSCDTTFRLKYNSTSSFDNSYIKEKIKTTLLNKYGVDNYFKRTDLVRQDWMRTIGVDNPQKSNDIFNKAQNTQVKSSYTKQRYLTKFDTIVTYQSKLELDFIQYCERDNIYIENGDSIKYILGNKERIYHIDFKIKLGNKYKLVELKAPHVWYYNDIKDGKLEAKRIAAEQHSKNNNYLPFKMYLDDGTDKKYF